jgi:FkbM family methyltransferase
MPVLKPMITYAQNFEDVMLRRVFNDRNDGFYIDVGAMDPIFDSVTNYFYEQGWSGINIEPNEWFYNKLVDGRPRDINLNVAIGDREECRSLYLFEQYGNSTFDEQSRDRFAEKGYASEEKTVRVTTLDAICGKYATRPIDFLKIDCEGWEKMAIQGADWERFRPTVVIVEATEPGTTVPSWIEWQPILENAQYEMVYFDGLNRFFLHRDCEKLRCHFGSPPNIFDDFRTYATVVAQQANHALRHERDSLAMRAAELEQKAQEDTAEIAQLREELRSLEQELLKSRLWVGQLSQELAASRRRLPR